MSDRGKSKGKGLQGQALKDFRSKVAKLKRKGVVSKRVDARSQKATKYMRAKVRKFEDVLSGQSIAVRAKPAARHKYTDAGIFEERGGFLIVPKPFENSRAKLKKGVDLIEITTRLKWGEEREVVLPFKATNILDLANKMAANHDDIDRLKKGDEQFAFRLFGHNSRKAFVDSREFVDHVLRNYKHLFSGKSGAEAVKHLSIIRFKGWGEDIPEADESNAYYEAPSYNIPRRIDATGRNDGGREDTLKRMRREARNLRKKKKRDKETPEVRTKRLAEQRQRSARNRQRKFEDE